MTITIEPPLDLQIVDIKVGLALPPRTVLALFIGYLVMEQKVPDEIIKQVDQMKEMDCPDGWRTFMSAWRNRSDDAVQDVYEILGQMIKDAVKT